MKRKLNWILVVLLIITTTKADAKQIYIPEGFEVIRCTCYLPTGNPTADGTVPFEGICASSREHLGDVAVIYDLDMRIVGFFQCRDTGSHPGLKNGTRIDIFMETEEEVQEWQATVGDYVIVQWVKGVG